MVSSTRDTNPIAMIENWSEFYDALPASYKSGKISSEDPLAQHYERTNLRTVGSDGVVWYVGDFQWEQDNRMETTTFMSWWFELKRMSLKGIPAPHSIQDVIHAIRSDDVLSEEETERLVGIAYEILS